MRISIVVPVYNIEKWLPQCVESILAQSYQDYELILVDDGATDQSGILCDAYAQQYSNVIALHKENGGLSDARNYGTSYATGDYLLYVDGDDYIGREALKYLSDAIEMGQPDIVLTEGQYNVTKDRVIEVCHFEKEKFKNISGQQAFLCTSKIAPNWAAWGKAYKLSFWKEHHFEFKKDRLSEDFQLIDQVLLQAKTVSMVDAFYYYQYRDDSIVHTVKEKFLTDLLKSFAEWKIYIESNKLDDAVVQQLYGLHAPVLCHSILGYIYVVESSRREELLQESNKYVGYLKYNQSMECRLIDASIRCIGMKSTCKLLAKIKKRKVRG